MISAGESAEEGKREEGTGGRGDVELVELEKGGLQGTWKKGWREKIRRDARGERMRLGMR
jgi:hypothetical protein